MKLLILVTGLLMLASCSFEEPYIPAWQSRVKVEFRSLSVEAADLIQSASLQDTVLGNATDTVYFFSTEDSLEKQTIDAEELAFVTEGEHINQTVGIIELDQPPPAETDTVRLSDLFPDLNLGAGSVLPPIPATTLQPPDQFTSFEDFQSITIDSANFRLEFANNLILTIAPGMRVTVYDETRYTDSDSGKVASFIFTDSIPSGTVAFSDPVALSGKILHNQIRLAYRIPLAPVDTATTLTQQDVDSYFITTVHLSTLRVTHAVADVPEQTVTRDDVTPIDTQDKSVSTLKIGQGAVALNVRNHLKIGADMTITLLNVLDANDQPRVVTMGLDANGQTQKTVNLAGAKVINADAPGEAIKELKYNIVAVTRPSNGFVDIDQNDSIAVDVTIDTLKIDYLEGDIGNITYDIDPIEQNDILGDSEINGSFTLPDVRLTFDFYNQIGFPVNANLYVTGYHRDAQSGLVTDSVTVSLEETIAAGNNSQAVKTTVVLDAQSGSPSIVDLMAIMPTDIRVSGNISVNGQGSLAARDAFWAAYRIESPLSIRIDKPVTVETDKSILTESDLDAETRDRITHDLVNVQLNLDIENGWPVGAQVAYIMAVDSNFVYDSTVTDARLKLVVPLTLPAGETDADGYVTRAGVTQNSIALDSTQLKIFEKMPLYIGTQVKIDATSGKIILRKHDAVTLSGNVIIDTKVDPNE
ncbi:MAG: hypothetical protein D6677_04380 [Calditrichaeota bacterium]|nr:MAG: hypothetical protein D6677_04380 [Calditrichota bacterium]